MESNTDNKAVSTSQSTPGWERETLEKLAFAAFEEQKKARKWGVFFKFLMFGYLILILGITMAPQLKKNIGLGSESKGHTAVIDVIGVIAENKETNADSIISSIRDAIKDKDTRGIILHINSPGGSPVQSDYVYNEIRRLKKEKPKLPIISVVSDICASGGYYIASAADKIYVNQASIIGSIGVIMNGFGFVDVLDKLGVERRLLTAGVHKAMLDPFSPAKESEKEHMQRLLDQVHDQFIHAVRSGRGERLKENDEMFSGLVWTGKEGVELGLADDFGNDRFVAKNVIGAEKLVNFTRQERLLDRLAGKLGAAFGRSFRVLTQEMSMQ